VQYYITNYKGHLLLNQKEISEVQYQAQIRNRKVINFRPHKVCFTALNSLKLLTEWLRMTAEGDLVLCSVTRCGQTLQPLLLYCRQALSCCDISAQTTEGCKIIIESEIIELENREGMSEQSRTIWDRIWGSIAYVGFI